MYQEQVEIQSNFFGKEIFGRQSNFDPNAVESLPQLDKNHSLGSPIQMVELKAALERTKKGKALGPNKIPVELYKYLDDENLFIILDILIKFLFP